MTKLSTYMYVTQPPSSSPSHCHSSAHCLTESEIWNLFLISKHFLTLPSFHRERMAANCSGEMSDMASGSRLSSVGMWLYGEREGGRE